MPPGATMVTPAVMVASGAPELPSLELLPVASTQTAVGAALTTWESVSELDVENLVSPE